MYNVASAWQCKTTYKFTLEAITKFGWLVLPHRPYSPYLAPSHVHLFGAQKNAVCSVKFKTVGDVIRAVRTSST
jgi:hypothetical protein